MNFVDWVAEVFLVVWPEEVGATLLGRELVLEFVGVGSDGFVWEIVFAAAAFVCFALSRFVFVVVDFLFVESEKQAVTRFAELMLGLGFPLEPLFQFL